MNNMLFTFLFLNVNLSLIHSFKTTFFFTKPTKKRNIYCNTYYNNNDTNNNQNNKNGKKMKGGFDERPFIKNVTQEQEDKYNFAKNLCMLQLLNALQNNDVPIYYKLFLIEKYHLVPNVVDNNAFESGYNILSGGLLENWDFEF
jgi:hypothetical protein